MKVIIDSWAWASKKDLSAAQLEALRRALTITPRKVGDHPGEAPSPISLFTENAAAFGMPRQFFLGRRKPAHEVEFRTIEGDKTEWPGDLKFAGTLREEQARGRVHIVAMLRAGCLGGIVRAVPGFGKTVLSCALMAELQVPTLVVVHKEFLMDQWRERIRQYLPDAQVGIAQGPDCDFKGKHVVLGMVHSLCEKDYGEDFNKYFGLVLTDECISGDSVIHTDRGLLPISELGSYPSIRVLTFNESTHKWEYRKVLRWLPRKSRKTLTIRVESRTVRCTPEHLFLTTAGWVQARNLKVGDSLLSPVAAAADRILQPLTLGVGAVNTLLDIAVKARAALIKLLEDWSWKPKHRYASAVAASTSGFPFLLIEKDCDFINGPNIFQDTIALANNEVPFLKRCLDFFTEPCLETPILESRTLPPTQESYLIMVGTKTNGQPTNLTGSSGSGFELNAVSMAATGSGPAVVAACATQGFNRFSPLLVLPSALPLSGCGAFPRKGGLGGTWMMAPSIVAGLFFTLKVFVKKMLGLSLPNSRRWVSAPAPTTTGGTTRSGFEPGAPLSGSNAFKSSAPPGWSTSFQKVTAIVDDPARGEEPVFDLDVDGNHNFVANGILVHNCHRIGSATWSRVPPLFPARWWLGLSATPRRKDGADAVFHHHIGEVIFASTEVRMKPKVRKVWITPDLFKIVHAPNFNSSLIKKGLLLRFMCVSAGRNRAITEQVLLAVRAGRKCLVVSERLQHLQDLETALYKQWGDAGAKPSVGFYIGGQTQEALDVASKAQVIFATSQLVQEGLDIPPLDTLFLTCPMGDVEQIAGRILRPFEGKKDPVVVDFRDDHINLCKKSGEYRDKFYKKQGWVP